MGTHGFSKNPYPYPPKTRTRDQGYRFLRVRVRVWAEIPRGYPWQSLAAAANTDEGADDGTKDQYNMMRDTGGEITRAGGRCKIHFLSFIKFIGNYPPNRIGKHSTTANKEEDDHDTSCSCHHH